MTNEKLASVTDVRDLKGKRVIVRSSLNVPVENGKVLNDYRIKEALPTIQFLVESGARIVLLAHAGRDPHNTLEPVFSELEQRLAITYVPKLFGSEVEHALSNLKNGEVLLLENVRSDERETINDETFARELAAYGELFVNDAFADSHREHASIIGIAKYLPSFAGRTFKKEFDELSKAFVPESPSLFILAGAKFETKQKLIKKFSETYDDVFIGGALGNDLLKARGCAIGASLVSNVDLSGDPIVKKENILSPIDAALEGPNGMRIGGVNDVHDDEKILDVGPASLEMLEPYIENAKTILWNGTLGYYEKGYVESTESCAKLVAQSSAHSIVGGGDTIAAIEKLGINDQFSFVSTAGGAMLTFLESGTLPGIEAILRSPRM